jgi:hypothetical protein
MSLQEYEMKVISNMKVGLCGAAILLGMACSAQAAQDQTSNDTQSVQAPAPKKLHLPLDHGPRAEVTPWVNEQRRLRAQQGK